MLDLEQQGVSANIAFDLKKTFSYLKKKREWIHLITQSSNTGATEVGSHRSATSQRRADQVIEHCVTIMNSKYGRLFEEMVIVHHDSGNTPAVTWRDRWNVVKVVPVHSMRVRGWVEV